MSLFKVEFNNNNAVSGKRVRGEAYKTAKEFGTEGTNPVIKWYIVDAENERQALQIADKVVRQIWGEVLGLT